MDGMAMQDQQDNLNAIMNQVQQHESSSAPSRDVNMPGNDPSASASQEPTPSSEWHQKLQQTTQEPYNTSAWKALVEFAEASGDLDKIKEAYEALLAKFPNTVRNPSLLCEKSWLKSA